MATMEIEMVDCGQGRAAEELKALMSKRNRNEFFNYYISKYREQNIIENIIC